MKPLEIGCAVFFTLTAVYLHILQSQVAGALWRDEANSIQLADLPKLSQLWRHLEFDSYPALFPLLLRVWGALISPSDASLRVLGLCIGLSMIAAFWLGARLLRGQVPLFALVLVGLNPMVVRYGDSIRGYGLGCTLALLALIAVWMVVSADHLGWRQIALATVAAILSVQCLYHNAALLLATCLSGALTALSQRRPKVAATVVAIGMIAALSLLPYLPIIARTRNWGGLLKVSLTVTWLWGKVSAVIGSPDPLGVWLWSALAILGLGLTVWTLRAVREPGALSVESSRRLFAATALAAGGLIYAKFLFTVGYSTQPWYYLAFLAVAGLCLDGIFGQRSPGNGWRLFRLAVSVLFAALTIQQSSVFLSARSTNVDRVAAILNSSVAPGDLVLVNRWECAVSLNRYYHGPARVLTIPPIEDHLVHRYDLIMETMQTADPLRPVFTAIRSTLQAGRRVWLVWLVGYASMPRPGESLPDLPPVTVKPGQDLPYEAYNGRWIMQASGFLMDHCVRAVAVKVPADGAISSYENLTLGCCNGWQTTAD